jgi:hypothetical protein
LMPSVLSCKDLSGKTLGLIRSSLHFIANRLTGKNLRNFNGIDSGCDYIFETLFSASASYVSPNCGVTPHRLRPVCLQVFHNPFCG